MKKAWVLVANKTGAKIFERKDPKTLNLVEVLTHPEGHLSEGELTSDKAGGHAVHSYGSPQNFVREDISVDHETDLFAKHICEHLESGRTHHDFDEFILVAEPAFLGVVKSNLSKQLEKHLGATVAKDLTREKEEGILEYI